MMPGRTVVFHGLALGADRSVAAGRVAWAVMAMAALLVSCSKGPPKRAKRAHHPASAAPTVPEDQAPVPAAAAPPAAAPAPMAVHVAEPPAPRHQLSVDPNPTPPPAPAPRRSARVPAARPAAFAARPAPEPPPKPAPKAVADKPSGSSCGPGGGDGEVLSVQGVASDDVLNVREAPDRTSAILGGLPPDTTGVRGTANRKRVGGSSWREIECGKLRGWVNEKFLAR
jgi:hypothetical protein